MAEAPRQGLQAAKSDGEVLFLIFSLVCSQMRGRATVEGFCLVQAEPSLPVFIGSNQTGGNNAWSSPCKAYAPQIMHVLALTSVKLATRVLLTSFLLWERLSC